MPKTTKDLYSQIIDFDNLWAAYHAARKSKRNRREVALYETNLEENLLNLHNHLIYGTWRPGKARCFTVYEPKWRDIQAPPFEDRIVHHALVRVIEPYFERKFIFNSYACRKDKGAQRAVKKLQQFMRQHQRHKQAYAVKADIKKYFASIIHAILISVVSRTIACERTLNLLLIILSAYGHDGIGMPVGALTSQLLANVLLNELDHAITDKHGFGKYIRYMDDFIIIVPSKEHAKQALEAIKMEVQKLGLELNPKTKYFPINRGVDFAGYRTWATHTLPRKRNVKKARLRFKQLAKAYKKGRITLKDARIQVHSFVAYMKHANSHKTTKSILNNFILVKGGV